MRALTDKQIARLKAFYKLSKKMPKLNEPRWLVRMLSRALPDYCIFARQSFICDKLWLFIPELCSLNPWFDAINNYREAEHE